MNVQVMQPLTGNFRAWLYWAETSLYGGETNIGLSSEYFVLYSEYYMFYFWTDYISGSMTIYIKYII